MAHPPPKLLPHCSERVLLVDCFQPTRDVCANILREHGIDVDNAEHLEEARFLFQSVRYDLVLLNIRRYPPAEALVFCRIIKDIDPDQRIALLVGPPSYITLNWQKELASADELFQHVETEAKRQAAAA